MPIIFHCENCKKKVKAPEEAGGKYGKCLYCGHRCYIPRPKSEDEQELNLAPIDKDEETQYQQMMRETRNLTQRILHETNIPDEIKSDPADEHILTKNIILYLRQMADGQLEQAHATAEKISPHRTQAAKILDTIAISEVPEPDLADIPPRILAGFIRNLRSRLT
ncbi:MAG: hypothetical protein ABIG61_16725 [Planctomycetota bacterium]